MKLTEHRVLTEQERKELQSVIERLSLQKEEDILRFVDTNLDKIYESEKIANFVRERVEKKSNYDSIKIHRSVINSYEKRNSRFLG